MNRIREKNKKKQTETVLEREKYEVKTETVEKTNSADYDEEARRTTEHGIEAT